MRLLVILALLVTMSAPPALAIDWQTLEDAEGLYRMKAPAGWQIQLGTGLIPVTEVMSPEEGPAAPYRERLSITHVEPHPGMSLAGYVANGRAVYQQLWAVQDQATASVAGTEAIRLVLDQTQAGVTTRQIKIFLAGNGRYYVVTGASEPRRFAEFLPTFEAAIASLALLPAPDPAAVRSYRGRDYRFTHPWSWRRFTESYLEVGLAKRFGESNGIVSIVRAPGRSAKAAFEADRERVDPAEDQEVVLAGQAMLGGLQGYRLVTKEQDFAYVDCRYVDRGGETMMVRLRYGDSAVPAELLKAFEQLLGTWSWD